MSANVDGKRFQDMIGFATNVSEQLRDRTDFQLSLSQEIRHRIEDLSIAQLKRCTTESLTLDQLGVEIWNSTLNLTGVLGEPSRVSDQTKADASAEIPMLLRVFAFYLLDSAYWTSSNASKDLSLAIRMFKVALKTISSCQSGKDLCLASKVIERTASYLDPLKEKTSPLSVVEDLNDNSAKAKLLAAEYYFYRAVHAWKTENLELAEFCANNVDDQSILCSSGVRFSAVETYISISQHCLDKRSYSTAQRWLARAGSILQGQHDQADDYRLTLNYSNFIKTQENIVKTGFSDTCNQVEADLVKEFRNRIALEHGSSMYLIECQDLLRIAPAGDIELCKALERLVSSAPPDERSTTLALQVAARLRQHDSISACESLAELLVHRVQDCNSLPEPTEELITCVGRLLVALTIFTLKARHLEDGNAVDLLYHCCCDVALSRSELIFEQVASAVQTLIWRHIEAQDSVLAERLCTILNCPLFSNVAPANQARVIRRAMAMALERDDLDAARTWFDQMAAECRDDPPSRYLTFKMSLRAREYDLARECLEIVATRASSSDKRYLYACISEACQSAHQNLAILTLKELIWSRPIGANLSVLLRCIACLYLSQIHCNEDDHENDHTKDILDSATDLFTLAGTKIGQLKEISGDNDAGWQREAAWWSKSSYHLSLQYCQSKNPEKMRLLLEASVKFNEEYRPANESVQWRGNRKRQLHCLSLASSANIILARTAVESPAKRHHYEQARQLIETFFARSDHYLHAGEDTAVCAWSFQLLQFDLECILRLKQWDRVDEALRRCASHQHSDRWDILADLIILLHDEKPQDRDLTTSLHVPKLLQRAVNETWKADSSISKIARWIRIAFAVDLERDDARRSDSGNRNGNNKGVDDGLGRDLVKQATQIARRGQEVLDVERYPEPELQWLAAMTFNHAVDLLDCTAKPEEDAQSWIDAALGLSYWASDNGSLHANLTGKVKILKERGMLLAQ